MSTVPGLLRSWLTNEACEVMTCVSEVSAGGLLSALAHDKHSTIRAVTGLYLH